MNHFTSIAVDTCRRDTYVPVADWEELLMLWTLRARNPARDGFTTVSWAIQRDGSRYYVVERLDGTIPHAHLGKTFSGPVAREEALDYWLAMTAAATPPGVQGVLPGFLVAAGRRGLHRDVCLQNGLRRPQLRAEPRTGRRLGVSKLDPRTRFYATQYGYYWSLTPTAFRRILAAGATGDGFELRGEGVRELKNKPRFVSHRWVYDMLDWYPENFREALTELDAGIVPSGSTWIWRA